MDGVRKTCELEAVDRVGELGGQLRERYRVSAFPPKRGIPSERTSADEGQKREQRPPQHCEAQKQALCALLRIPAAAQL